MGLFSYIQVQLFSFRKKTRARKLFFPTDQNQFRETRTSRLEVKTIFLSPTVKNSTQIYLTDPFTLTIFVSSSANQKIPLPDYKNNVVCLIDKKCNAHLNSQWAH